MTAAPERTETAREHLRNATQVLRSFNDAADAGCRWGISDALLAIEAVQRRLAAAVDAIDQGCI